MNPPPDNHPTTEYMLNEMNRLTERVGETQDLAYKMMLKIFKMFKTCINTFENANITVAPWLSFPEGPTGIAFDLSANPPIRVLYGLFARIMFLSSYYYVAWEEVFTTGFFEYETQVFNPLAAPNVRFLAYIGAEQQHHRRRQLRTEEAAARHQYWLEQQEQLERRYLATNPDLSQVSWRRSRR